MGKTTKLQTVPKPKKPAITHTDIAELRRGILSLWAEWRELQSVPKPTTRAEIESLIDAGKRAVYAEMDRREQYRRLDAAGRPGVNPPKPSALERLREWWQ